MSFEMTKKFAAVARPAARGRSLAGALILAGTLLSPGVLHAQVVLRLGHVAPEQNIYHLAAVHFAEKVSEYSNEEVRVDIFPGAQLGGDRDLLEGVQLGTVDVGYISLAVFEGLTPVMTGFQMPFLIESYETSQAALTSSIARDALDELDPFGMIGLAIVENGFRVAGNTVRPIRAPEDFEGISFRAPEAQLQLSMFSLLGANVTPMPFPEIYTGLQAGVIQGQDQILQTWMNTRAYEVVDYLSMTRMYTWPAVIAINQGRFNSLSEDQQDALMRAAVDTQAYTFGILNETDAEALAALKAEGLQVESNINLQPFVDLLMPLYEEYSEKHPLVARTIQFITEARER